MAKNRIFQLRKAAGLTQRELAQRVGTTQQQIQRIEAGVTAARLDLATKIADALRADLRRVFPSLPKVTSTAGRSSSAPEQLQRKFSKAGIDIDPRIWTVRIFVSDGREFLFDISSSDKNYLESGITSDKKFLIFDSTNSRVAVKRSKIAACQFLFETPLIRRNVAENDEYELNLHLVEASAPLKFDLEPDAEYAIADDDGSQSQLQRLFFYLDGLDEDDEEVLWFDDADAERVYMQSKDLLLVEMPLVCCEPSLWKKSLESLSEDESAVDSIAHTASEKP